MLLSGFQHCTVLACSPLLYLPEAGRGIDVSKKPLRLPYEFLVSQGGLSLSHLYQYVLQLQFQGRRCPCSYCSVTCSRKNIFLEESIVPVLGTRSCSLNSFGSPHSLRTSAAQGSRCSALPISSCAALSEPGPENGGVTQPAAAGSPALPGKLVCSSGLYFSSLHISISLIKCQA